MKVLLKYLIMLIIPIVSFLVFPFVYLVTSIFSSMYYSKFILIVREVNEVAFILYMAFGTVFWLSLVISLEFFIAATFDDILYDNLKKLFKRGIK